MVNDRKYKLNFDARILQMLGPNLYTNIYYVLAEIIANSYDADAKNVYIYSREDVIAIEDDGSGMSYRSGEIGRYLEVGKESRCDSSNSYTSGGRLKMGRKGIGKLAALSVSDRVIIHTISKSGERSGFILSAIDVHDNVLPSIPESEVKLSYQQSHGTLVRMQDPKLRLHKTPEVVKKNLARLFPIISDDFTIHIDLDGKKCSLSSYDDSLVPELAALITLGEDFSFFSKKFSSIDASLLRSRSAHSINISLRGKNSIIREYTLDIRGWIGAYKRSKSRRNDDISDFPASYISLLANGKVGEFNILPLVGANRLWEVYIVGQLHVDLFEHSDLPDMALSNRQGYQTADKRYQEVIQYVRNNLLPEISGMRSRYTTIKNKNRLHHAKAGERTISGSDDIDSPSRNIAPDTRLDSDSSNEENILYDSALKDDLEREFISSIEEKISSGSGAHFGRDEFLEVAGSAFNDILSEPAISTSRFRAPSDDRKILISHTSEDKDLADIIYKMLIFNNVSAGDIIYTSCDDEISRIRQGQNIYGILKNEFFVRKDYIEDSAK